MNINDSLSRTAMAVALLLLGACADITEGVVVDLSVEAVNVPERVALDDGELEVDGIALTVFSVELLPCETARPQGYALRIPRLVARAHAHVEGSPTTVGRTVVVSNGHTSWIRYDTFAPPPGRYCAVRADLFAADEDAEGAADVVGSTAQLRGSLRTTGSEQPLLLAPNASYDARLDFAEPLELTPSSDVELVIRWDVGATLASVAWCQMQPDELGAALLVAIPPHLSVDVVSLQ